MKKISSQEIYKGKVIHVVKDKVLLDDGTETYREVVKHHNAVAVVAIDEDNNVLLVEQYRYPILMNLTELPAGLIDEGENPLDCAVRELWEETGYKAKNWKLLTEFYPSPGAHDEKIYIFLATDLKKVSEQNLDSDEMLTCKKISFESILEKARKGQILDCKTVIGVLLAQNILMNENGDAF